MSDELIRIKEVSWKTTDYDETDEVSRKVDCTDDDDAYWTERSVTFNEEGAEVGGRTITDDDRWREERAEESPNAWKISAVLI